VLQTKAQMLATMSHYFQWLIYLFIVGVVLYKSGMEYLLSEDRELNKSEGE
jgi:uncharacterized membrane-anchored protein YitT (DUF2179 family)